MAEQADNKLMLSILKQLQTDVTELKGLANEHALELVTLRKGQERTLDEVTYALGMMVVTQRNTKDAQTRLDDMVERLEKLEPSSG